jgi:O-acetyl-ADP-ribose deacetylase (regulator of RNase III)
MTRNERLDYLIDYLAPDINKPYDVAEKWLLFRALVNVREPKPVSNDFLRVQDALLQELITEKGITDIEKMTPIRSNLYLWRGDITTLRVGAIVNAANSGMLGCFVPGHSCIDNAIHTFAGVQLRLECSEIMVRQEYPEQTGRAKITKAYNLPCEYILHTVGPIIKSKVSRQDEELLASCYRSCLDLAVKYAIESVALCCISTGVFHFPHERAAEIAVTVVRSFLQEQSTKVVFNVFAGQDYEIYSQLLKR